MRATIAAFLLLTIVFFASPAHAADGLVPCDGPDCGTCELMQFGSNILEFLVQASILIAGLAFAWGGFKMITSAGESGSISEAKSMMTNAVVGIVIVMSAWLLVDTLIKLVVDKSTLGVWNEIQCTTQAEPPPSQQSGIVRQAPVDLVRDTLDHQSALAEIGGAVQVVSSGNCTDRTKPNCTSLEGIQRSTLETVKDVVDTCPECLLQITAGTEVGHKNACHQSGTCVDIDCVNGCPVSRINDVVSAASQNGARAVYEVSDALRKNMLVNQGVDAANIQVVSWITGEHFSLYTQ